MNLPVLLVALAGCSHAEGSCKPTVKLELRAVIEGSDAMTKIFRHVGADRTMAPTDQAARDAGVSVDVDVWRDEVATNHTDYFLRGKTRAAIEAYVASLPADLQPPKDHALVYEPTERGSRSYYVEASGFVPRATSATIAREQNVDVGLDEAGTKTFAALTTKLLGHKLATLVDGEVAGAPVIASAINGGHFWITTRTPADARRVLAAMHCD